jgi:hypothetical protein
VSGNARRPWRVPGVVWALVGVVAVYFVLGWLFAHETRVRGLLTPGGSPNLDVLALGGVYLVVRVAVRFGVPLLVSLAAARVIGAKLGAWRARKW